jgi:hypothetical membrane protein
MSNISLRERIFGWVPLCCILFVVLSSVAMIFYPGGIKNDSSTHGYSFLLNYFSDLGRFRARNGVTNTVSSVLFTSALALAGLGLTLFFSAFAGLFRDGLFLRVVALWSGALGILAGICFVGVAFTPSDVSRLHGTFVIWAFRFFLGAVLPFALAIFCQKSYPKIGAWLFIAFAALLAAYIELLIYGPGASTPNGLMIQVTGQKLIVYASVLCVWMQSIVARQFVRRAQLQ